MRVAALGLSRAAACMIAAAGLAEMGAPAPAAADDSAAHAIADKFSRAEDAEAKKAKDEQARKAAAEALRRHAAEQRAADEADLQAQARAEAEARRAADKRKAEEQDRIEAERDAARAQGAELAREAEARRQEELAKAEEARKAEAARLERQVEEQRLTDARRQAEEQKRAEAARLAKEAEEKRIAEEQRQAEEAQAALEARRQEEAQRIADKFRMAREAREARARESEQSTRSSLGGPPPAPWDDQLAGDDAAHAGEAGLLPARVTVLLVVEPKESKFTGMPRSPNLVLCVGESCYVSSGAGAPAITMPRWQTLGPANTLGRRAGPCNRHPTCVFRSVELTRNTAWIQPISMGFWHHDRLDIRTVSPDRTCEVAGRQLYCAKPIVAHGYRAWIVPEDTARRAGAAALEEAVESGLPLARSASGETWTAKVQALPTR
jgi:chemotaxis protein histidine kinase CheA